MFGFGGNNNSKKNNNAMNVNSGLKVLKNQGILKRGQEICENTLNELSLDDRATIINMVAEAPAAIDYLKTQVATAMSKYDLTKVEDVTKMVNKYNEMVKKSGKNVKSYVKMLDDKDKREQVDKITKAAAAYLKCLIEQVPDEYKRMMLSIFQLGMTSVGIVTKEPKIREFSEYVVRSIKNSGKGLLKSAKVSSARRPRKNNSAKNNNA